MRVSSVNQGLPFKATVESTSPLVAGNWAFLEDTTPKAKPKEKSHWLRNTVIALALIGLATWGLIRGRKTDAIDKVMKAGYENLTTVSEKFKYGIGKLGDYATLAYNKTIGKAVTFIKTKLPKAAEEVA